MAIIFAGRGSLDICPGVEQAGHYCRIGRRCPCRCDIASKELWYSSHSNNILQAHGFARHRAALRVSTNEKLMRPGLSKDLLFFPASTYILPRVFGLVRHWLVIGECSHILRAVVHRCEKSVEITRLARVDGESQGLDQGFSIALFNGVIPGFRGQLKLRSKTRLQRWFALTWKYS